MSSAIGEAVGMPRTLGPFRIVSTIGQGGMGVVYRAEHAGTGQAVAIKTVRIPRESDLAGIRLEIHALTRMKHPGIVRILGQGMEGGLPWYAMELLIGTTLSDFWRGLWDPERESFVDSPTLYEHGSDPLAKTMAAEPGPTNLKETITSGGDDYWNDGGAGDSWHPEIVKRPGMPRAAVASGKLPEVLTLMRRLCDPLAFIHGQGIVHRDLKPNNIFIRPDGTPVLMDFGLVSRAHGGLGREALEISGKLVGTIGYMAPEQIQGQPVDARCDLYALGCIFYELLTGRLPFVSATTSGMFDHHLGTPPTPPSALVDHVPAALDRLVIGLLEKRPRERIGHADDVSSILVELGALPAAGIEARDDRARAYLYRPELAGRAATVEELGGLLERACDGQGGLVLIGGESGVGKTCLATAAARMAMMRRMQVIIGECAAVATSEHPLADGIRGAPLHPFSRLLQSISDRCRQRGRAAADNLLGARGKLLSPYEPALVGIPGQDEFPAPAELVGEEARRRLLGALAETMARFAEDQPLLLVIDDLQWADETSLAFLASLGADYFASRRVVILGTYRSEETTLDLRRMVATPGVRNFDLSRLDETTVGAIVADMLAMTSPPASLVQVLARQTEGNPFYVAEYLRAAVAERLLYREGGKWRLALDDQENGAALSADGVLLRLPRLPGSLRELIGRRIAGIGVEARRLVEAAAVLGREVEFEVWCAVAEMTDPEEALEAVKELCERQVFELVDSGDYRFVHDKLREIAYEQLPHERRRTLHGAAARKVEEHFAGSSGLSLRFGALARHWKEAEVWPKAIDYFEKAAEQAVAGFSNREALTFLNEAQALSERIPGYVDALRFGRWERCRVDAHLGLGEYMKVREHAEKALRHFGQPAPLTKKGWAGGLAGQIAIRVAQSYAPALFPAGSATARAAAREASAVLNRMFDFFIYNGEPLLAVYCGMRSLNLAEGLEPTRAQARSLTMMSIVLSNTPLKSTADAYSERSLRLAEEIGDPATRNYCLVRCATQSFSACRWEEAFDRLDRGAEISRAAGDQRGTEEADSARSLCLYIGARYEESFASAQRALASAIVRGDSQIQAWGRCSMAQALTRLGRAGEAIERVEQSLPWVDASGTALETIWSYGTRARARLQAGDLDGALADADRALDWMQRDKLVGYFYKFPVEAVVNVYHAAFEAQAGAAMATRRLLLDKARKATGLLVGLRTTYPFSAPSGLIAEGIQKRCEGDRKAPERIVRRALADAEAKALPYEMAQTRFHLGSFGDGGHASRSELERALAGFTNLGCTTEARAVRDRLEALGRR